MYGEMGMWGLWRGSVVEDDLVVDCGEYGGEGDRVYDFGGQGTG